MKSLELNVKYNDVCLFLFLILFVFDIVVKKLIKLVIKYICEIF